MEIVERLDEQDVESYPAIDEGRGDLHVADDWGAKHQEDSGRCRTLELVCGTECDRARRPPERARGLKLGKDCIHLASKLLEDAL